MLSINEIEEIKEQAYVGVPSILKNTCLVYPHSVKDIITIGSNNYYKSLGILLLSKDDIADLIKKKIGVAPQDEEVPEPLEYLIMSANANDTFLLELQDIFFTFIKEEILILPELEMIVIGNPKEKRIIDKNNFSDFQDILKIQHRKEIAMPPPPNETPGQKKMRLLRERTVKIKKKQAQKNSEKQSFVELLEIAETFGISLEHSVYAFYGLIKRHRYREKWNNDISMLCAGADGTKLKTKYWGESLEEE